MLPPICQLDPVEVCGTIGAEYGTAYSKIVPLDRILANMTSVHKGHRHTEGALK